MRALRTRPSPPAKPRPGGRGPWVAAGALLLAALIGWGQPLQADEERPPPRSGGVLSSPYDDRDVGEVAAERAGAEIGLIEDPELNDYVERVGRRLARHAPGYAFDYRFRILDDGAPNAFALPGGWVFVSRGLLVLSNSEDELAGVLGHEIAHAALRHAAARQQVTGPALLQAFRLPYLMAYSRDLERSADRVGQGLAGVAGYDPRGLTDFLSSLDGYERLRVGAPRLPSFFDTHPGTGERIADTAHRAGDIRWTRAPGVVGGREQHLERVAGLVVGESAQQGVFAGSRFLHPDLGFTLRFPDGWTLKNTPRAVGAIAPDRRGQVFLELGGRGADASAAAAAWTEEGRGQGLRVYDSRPVQLLGRPAQRVTGRVSGAGGGFDLHATFLAWRGQIYRLLGVSAAFDRYEPIFTSVARSFRPMTAELLEGVREQRVRLLRAEPGETPGDVGRRSGSAWEGARLAVLNGVQPSHRFAGGERVKVVGSEPYRPAGAPPTPAPEE